MLKEEGDFSALGTIQATILWDQPEHLVFLRGEERGRGKNALPLSAKPLKSLMQKLDYSGTTAQILH